MRNIIFLALAALTMVLWSSTAIYAQTIPEEEGEEVIITETPPPVTGPIRNPVLIPISVTYYSSIATIGLEFMDLIGEVSVSISNLSTTESYNTVVYSQNGSAFIPISGNPGLWQIILTLDTGASYIGFFSIVQ
ncbi:MAG: hypothetical protein K6G79_09355 [Bacteroidales bacterium]|nr:hypothetical protein [Bacteroidales bacterium]